MNRIVISIAMALSAPAAFAGVDYQCQSDCTKRYTYQYCSQLCTITPRESQTITPPNIFGSFLKGRRAAQDEEARRAELEALQVETEILRRESEEARISQESKRENPTSDTPQVTQSGGDWIRETKQLGSWTGAALSSDASIFFLSSRKQLKIEGEIVGIWHRLEMKSGISSVQRDEYNCKESLSRTVSSTTYSRRNLEGDSTTDTNPTDWAPAIPGTLGEVLFEQACALMTTTDKPSIDKPKK